MYEKLGGNIPQLIANSPASKLASEILKARPNFQKDLQKSLNEKSSKESAMKSHGKGVPGPETLYARNSRYKMLHLMKILSKQVLVGRPLTIGARTAQES